MTEYLEREKALQFHLKVNASPEKRSVAQVVADAIAEYIKVLPAEDVAPVVHGHWVVKYDIWGKNVKTVEGYKCSKCDGFCFYQDNYCADCGARMDEVTE